MNNLFNFWVRIPNSSIDFSRMCDLESDNSSKFSMSDGLEIKDDLFLSSYFEDDDSNYYLKDAEGDRNDKTIYEDDDSDSESSSSTEDEKKMEVEVKKEEEICTEIPEISSENENVKSGEIETSCTNIEITNNTETCNKDDKINNNNNGCMEREQQRQVIVNIESVNEDDLYLYNSYNYWYISPELPLDPNIVNDGEMRGNQQWNMNVSIAFSIFFLVYLSKYLFSKANFNLAYNKKTSPDPLCFFLFD